MPVENKYVDSLVAAGKKAAAVNEQGTGTVAMIATVAVAAADDDGSIFRCFPNLPASYIPIKITVHNTAITAGTSYSLGLYKTGLGAAVSSAALASALDMSSARTIATENNAGMSALTLSDGSRDLAELSGQTKPDAAYDLCLTATTVGTAAGTIRVTAIFATK